MNESEKNNEIRKPRMYQIDLIQPESNQIDLYKNIFNNSNDNGVLYKNIFNNSNDNKLLYKNIFNSSNDNGVLHKNIFNDLINKKHQQIDTFI